MVPTTTHLPTASSEVSSSSPTPSPPGSPFNRPRSPAPKTDFAMAAFQTEESVQVLVDAFKVYDRNQMERRRLEAIFGYRDRTGYLTDNDIDTKASQSSEKEGRQIPVPLHVVPANQYHPLATSSGSASATTPTLVGPEYEDEKERIARAIKNSRMGRNHEMINGVGIDINKTPMLDPSGRPTGQYYYKFTASEPSTGLLPVHKSSDDTQPMSIVTGGKHKEGEEGSRSRSRMEVVVEQEEGKSASDTETVIATATAAQVETSGLSKKQKKQRQKANKKLRKVEGGVVKSTAAQAGNEGNAGNKEEREVEGIVGLEQQGGTKDDDHVKVAESADEPSPEFEGNNLSSSLSISVSLSVTDFSTPELIERIDQPISPEYVEINHEEASAKHDVEEGIDFSPSHVGISPPESIRTEMTLVLGDDGGDQPAIVAAPPGSMVARSEPQELETPAVIVLPPARPRSSNPTNDISSVIIAAKPPPCTPSGPTALLEFGNNEISQQDQPPILTPIQQDSPQEPLLVTPPILQFGSIVPSQEGWQARKAPPHHASISRQVSSYHIRSPLAVVPPITAATLGLPVSLEPTRQNSPVSDTTDPSRPQTQVSGLGLGMEDDITSLDNTVMPQEVDRQEPSSLELVKLNHPYTLYTTNQVGSPPQVPTRYPAGLSATPSADTYRSELVHIFTAHTFGDFFGSWKALRRKIGALYNRPIEEEGSNHMIPGTEGLGINLAPKDKTLQFFRTDVKPMWEDPMCLKGGKIMLSARNNDEVDQMFFKLALTVVAGWLEFDTNGSDAMVLGIVCKMGKFGRIEIWLGGSEAPPSEWVKEVETFLKKDCPGQWYPYKPFRKA